MSRGVDLIAAERARQKLAVGDGGEGYDADHDSGHDDELATAAAVYAIPPADRILEGDVGSAAAVRVDLVAALWPWDRRFWKPLTDGSNASRVAELTKAGALIAAAIDSILDV